jgi:outer membrane immunogenic protein
MVAKTFWLAGSALALLAAGTAMAADLPTPAPVYKAAPAVVAPINWTGFYIGAGAGNASWNAITSVSTAGGAPLFGNNSQGGAGWLGTVVAGYDYQVDRVVVGVLGAYDFAGVKGFYSDPGSAGVGPAANEGIMKETSAWIAGARVGWLVFPEFLAYVSGGYSQAHFSAFGLTPTGDTIPSHTYSGWFAGVGAETTFPILGNGWFFRSDYRFAQYGNASLAETSPAGAVVNIQNVRPSVQTISAALIYKFNAAAPALPGFSLASFSFGDFFRPVPGPARWTGFYLAGGGGYGIWHAGTTFASPAGPVAGDTQSGRGWFGTVNAGYDYQLSTRLVAGVFGDFDFAGIRGTFQDQSTPAPGLAGTMTERNAWYAGVRGGWLITPTILSYYNVGYTQANFGNVNLSGVTTLASHTYSGWFVGTGLETALPFLGNGWFARIEYRYASYRNASTSALFASGAVADVISFQPRIETLRTELVYRF